MSKKLNQPKPKSRLNDVIFWLVILVLLWRGIFYVNWSNVINAAKSFVSQYSVVVGILCLIGLIAPGVIIVSARRTSTKERKLYEEMVSALRSILVPLGFKEKEKFQSKAHKPDVYFSRGRLSVVFWWNRQDNTYCVDGSSKESLDERQARIDELMAKATDLTEDELKEIDVDQNDFSVEREITDPKFKGDVIAELNKWLLRQGVR